METERHKAKSISQYCWLDRNDRRLVRVHLNHNFTMIPSSNKKSFARLFMLFVAISIIASLALPGGLNPLGQAEAGGKGKGKGKGGNIIISTSGGGGGGSYSYPIPIPIPIHCDGGRSYWRRRRR